MGLMQGDEVSYVGTKYKTLGDSKGVVLAPVRNCREELVVEFGDDAFVIPETDLVSFRGYKNKPKEKFWIFPPAQADFRGYYIKYLYSD